MFSELVWPVLLVLIHALVVCAQWAAWHHRRPGPVSLDSSSIVTRVSAERPAEGVGEPSSDGPGVRRIAPAQARTQRDIVVYGLLPSSPTLWAAEAALLQLVQWLLGPAVMAPRPVAVRLWRQRSGRWAARFQVSNELYWAIWASKWQLGGTKVSIHRWCPPERMGEHMAARRRMVEAAQRRRSQQGKQRQEQHTVQHQELQQEQHGEIMAQAPRQWQQRQVAPQEAPKEVTSCAAAHAFLEQLAAEQHEQQPQQEQQPIPAASASPAWRPHFTTPGRRRLACRRRLLTPLLMPHPPANRYCPMLTTTTATW